ncbi:MAG: LysE family transporter [Dehalococcoidia bacterium]|nr:LysE family transporter [Dehalococcoidia bacterium]
MALLAIFANTFLISLSGALMPGPLFTLSVRETLRRGFWVGPMVAAGHGLIELALVIGLALGLSEFLDEGLGTAVIALLGGLFLLWMGYQMVRTAPRQELRLDVDSLPNSSDGQPASGGYRRRLVAAMAGTDAAVASNRPLPMLGVLVPAGILVSVANPYWIIWWASIGMAYLTESLDHGAAGVSSFFTAHILSDFLWLSFVAFVLASGRRMMSARTYRAILFVCGVFLLAIGVRFVYSAFDFLM